MVNDPIAISLEKRKLWRRAATRWLELLTSRDLTATEMDWVLARRDYCTRKTKRTEPLIDSGAIHGAPNSFIYDYFGFLRK